MYQQLPLHKPHLSGPDSLKIPTLDPQVRFLLFSSCASLAADPTCILLATGTTPPTVAINERVRKSPPRTTSVETTTILKRPKTDSAGSRGCTRVSDFDDLTRSLADETISIYQAQITAVQPWPSTAENWESVSQGWVEVCTSRNVRIELDDEIFKAVRISFHFLLSIFHHSLLYDRATQARGHAKTISKPYVVSAFSLDTPTSKRAIRNKVEELLDEARYIYKACSLFLPVLYNP
jgi:hypothetical protein